MELVHLHDVRTSTGKLVSSVKDRRTYLARQALGFKQRGDDAYCTTLDGVLQVGQVVLSAVLAGRV